MPIGITPGADGNMWFCAKKANKIGRIAVDGEITLFPLPTPDAGPDGTLVDPDGNVWEIMWMDAAALAQTPEMA